ncbi:MAG TPA: flavin reductase family protein [Solirubrobacterales bacterium]
MTPGSPPLDPEVFRSLMGGVAGHVAVVTALDPEGRPVGLTTTAVTSVSAEPPLLLVCVDLTSRTLPALRQGRRFVVNFMHDGSEALAARFASKRDDKFAGVEWRPSAHGIPVLSAHSIGWAECRIVEEVEAGDHVVLIGGLEAGEIVDEEGGALLYHRRRFGSWAPLASSS